MIILAYNVTKKDNKLFLTCSDGRTLNTDKWDEVACFLLMPTEMALVWQIDKFVDDITSTLPVDVKNKVLQGGRVYTPDNRKVFYAPNRMFGINQVDVYSLSRYANEKIDDAVELLKLGEKVIRAYKQFGIEATRLSSPVAVYGEVLNNLSFPRACDLPDSAFGLTQACAKVMTREWRELFSIGYFTDDENSDYDIVAGYPSIVAKLPDISGAKFFKSKIMPDQYSWGEMYGKLKIVKPISPFVYQPKNCYPIGEWEDSISTDQYWLLKKWGIGDFTMEYGNFFTLPKYYDYPFKEMMERLFALRQNDDELISKIAKGISVGIWGKFAEVHEKNKLGDQFNSIYARMTTSRCMVKTADFIYRNSLDPISVLVDGVLATNRIALNDSKGMGAWRMNEPMPALVLSLLFQWQGDKKPANMTYSQVMELINKSPDNYLYGEVDINLLNYSREFQELPKTGGELISKTYNSKPYEIKV